MMEAFPGGTMTTLQAGPKRRTTWGWPGTTHLLTQTLVTKNYPSVDSLMATNRPSHDSQSISITFCSMPMCHVNTRYLSS